MSIRGLAQELYRAQKQVDALKKKLEDSELSPAEREETRDRLRRAQAERDRLKGFLEGAKAG